jgi:hypothetical protein
MMPGPNIDDGSGLSSIANLPESWRMYTAVQAEIANEPFFLEATVVDFFA